MLTQTVEYALRIAICLAKSDPRPKTAAEIARTTNVPRAYLAKVIQAMVRGGTARSKRGVGGGISLAKPASELTLLDVINSVSPLRSAQTPSTGEMASAAVLPGLNQRFEKALVAVEDIFSQATLADMAAEGPDSHASADERREPRDIQLRRAIGKAAAASIAAPGSRFNDDSFRERNAVSIDRRE